MRIGIEEAFRLMKKTPGTRYRPKSWASGGGNRWIEFRAGGDPDGGEWLAFSESSQGLLEHSTALWFDGHTWLDEWERVDPLCEVKEVVYPQGWSSLFPMLAAAESIALTGKRLRVYARSPNAERLRSVLPAPCVYGPHYATDRWEDTEAEAIIGSEVWDSMSREAQDTVRRHHSGVTVVTVRTKEEETA